MAARMATFVEHGGYYFGLIARSLLVGHSPPLWLLPFLHATFLGIALPFVLVVIALNILQAVAVKPCKV